MYNITEITRLDTWNIFQVLTFSESNLNKIIHKTMKNEVYQPTATDTLTGDDEDGDAKGTYA